MLNASSPRDLRFMAWLRPLSALAIAFLTTSCQDLADLELLIDWLRFGSALPDCVSSDCNCADFASQPEAQRVLDAFDDDPFGLDSDGNGWACESLPKTAPKTANAPRTANHLLLGRPQGDDANSLLLEKPEYVLSYSKERGTANWASWQLSADWLGDAERQNDFRPDAALPAGLDAVRPGDYDGSGYDRGHLVPSGDRTVTEAVNSATFVMTNIIPQTTENNREPWRRLETFSRALVDQGQDLYIIAGVYGNQGRIADGTVTVPTNTWKVIVVLPPGAGLGDIDIDTPVIAVDIPNGDRLDGWGDYLTTVDVIEGATGYDLLSNVPKRVQAVVESRQFQGF
ncbi:MAG: DNA/RNA non-specific endonuclease [Elainellaceae cyanobacterium]